MTALNIIYGFQWLNGSFMENIEISQNRPPKDLDVVTFFGNLSLADQANLRSTFPEFGNPSLSKNNFNIDHYPVDYTYRPEVTVEQTRYWLQLFTHNRIGIWKGILKLPLNTPIEDQHALDYLNSI